MAETQPNQTANPAPDWKTGLNDDMKAFANNKGFKDPSDVLNSYVNMEKLMGVPKDRLLKLPEKMEGDEARAIWNQLGAPKEAKDYQIDPSKVGDEKVAELLSSAFFETGVAKTAADKIVEKIAAHTEMTKAQKTEAMKQAIAAGEKALKADWGPAFEQNEQIAKEGAKIMGLDAKQVDAMAEMLGHEKVMKLMHKFGTATGEAKFITGNPKGMVMDSVSAKAEIKALMADKTFQDRRLSGDKESVAKWNYLFETAYPGTQPL